MTNWYYLWTSYFFFSMVLEPQLEDKALFLRIHGIPTSNNTETLFDSIPLHTQVFFVENLYFRIIFSNLFRNFRFRISMECCHCTQKAHIFWWSFLFYCDFFENTAHYWEKTTLLRNFCTYFCGEMRFSTKLKQSDENFTFCFRFSMAFFLLVVWWLWLFVWRWFFKCLVF